MGRFTLGLGLAVAVSLLSCNRVDLDRPAVGSATNLVLVTIDTLRADHVGAYGADFAHTPHLDALAARGARFETAISSGPLTLPSHATIMTGQFPPSHGVRHNGVYKLPDSAQTLAERLREAGYATGAVVGAVVLHRRYGLAQGFEFYDDAISGDQSGEGGYLERSATDVTERALAWLAEVERPFFLWLHYYDPHAAYRPPAPYDRQFASSPYDGEIAYVDAQLGRLLSALEERGELERTLTVVTSDHGESLGEHGEAGHSYTLYDSVLRVPWLLAGPGLPEGRVVEPLARIADVAPTVLALLGLRAESMGEGRDLTPQLHGTGSTEALAGYAETHATRIDHGWSPLFALRTDEYLYIDAPRPELYAVKSDPHQLSDLSSSAPESLRTGLSAELVALGREDSSGAEARLQVDEETRRALEALGYALPAGEIPETGADPKDGLASLAAFYRGVSAYEAGRFEEAISILEGALQRLPESPKVHGYLGHAHMRRRRPDLALPHLEAATRLNPASAGFWAVLGDARRQLGNGREAAEAYRRAAGIDPTEPLAQLGLQWIYARQGDLARAEAHAERALRHDSKGEVTLVRIGLVWEEVGATVRARNAYARAVERAPELRFAHMMLAIALAREGRAAESEAHLARAGSLAADPQLAARLEAAREAARESSALPAKPSPAS